MAREDTTVIGLFEDDRQAAAAIRDLRTTSWKLSTVHSPFPSEPVTEALAGKKTPVGWFTLAGGIIGLFAGYLLASLTAMRWDLIVGGKPVLAFVPFLIVGFEFAVLCSVLGNVTGFILLTRLPAYKDLSGYAEACSGRHFGVAVACEPWQREAVRDFFLQRGASLSET